MKVLLIDNATDGHHLAYAKALRAGAAYESVLVLPEGGDIACRAGKLSGLHPFAYLRWLRAIKRIVRREKPDVVHFLNANALVNYWGVGLGALRRCGLVFTYHLHFAGKWKEIGHRRLAKRGVSVVHTAALARKFAAYGGRTVHIEYPDFSPSEEAVPPAAARTLLALGQTRYEKGLDLLLEALKGIEGDFRLIVAGAPVDFDAAYIESATASYRDRVTQDLRFLPEEAMYAYLKACDIVVLPYRRRFDGASGPLTEGVGFQKRIIGPSEGSLGEIIRDNHIGDTFPAEDVGKLRECIERALGTVFVYDETALRYRDFLSPERFRRDYAALYFSL